jgi:hypothetical protein
VEQRRPANAPRRANGVHLTLRTRADPRKEATQRRGRTCPMTNGPNLVVGVGADRPDRPRD